MPTERIQRRIEALLDQVDKADGGQVLVTDTVRNLVAGKDYRFHDRGTHDLKGFEEPARLFEVGWA